MSHRPAADDAVVWDQRALRDPHLQPDKARRVRMMFDAIAATYERVNTISSLGRDSAWRRRTVSLAAVTPADRVLDVACGTGDLVRAFSAAGAATVVGADFSPRMLAEAAARPVPRATWCLSDALRLPFRGDTFTIISCAFGVRNFQSLETGLAEMHRVLRPGGRVVILEFSRPRVPGVRRLFEFYSHALMPRLATWLSGDRSGAYRYLPNSVSSFVDEAGMEAALRGVGYESVERHPLTLGIVHVYTARKAP